MYLPETDLGFTARMVGGVNFSGGSLKEGSGNC